MKSKKIWLILIGGLIVLTLVWAWWQLKPKAKDSFTDKEISIKQADIPEMETVLYEDWAGFKFDYPSILTVKEIELDNPNIYSSLELFGSDAKRLTVRVSDSQIASLIDWQKSFNLQNSVRKIDQTTLADLPALHLQYGAPEMMMTVALSDGIIYEVLSPADDGFWDRTHEDLVSSWQFTTSVTPDVAGSSGNDTITLIEETVE
ncbi:MAG: hypothetical protein U1C50_03115 [Patescibacteria group bacterium]|nr:hypothetical protein [Patescibacteria group bacterium]